jgi:hypothetical protein
MNPLHFSGIDSRKPLLSKNVSAFNTLDDRLRSQGNDSDIRTAPAAQNGSEARG